MIAFQISSILFADESFAKQYESYSLNIAKTNAQKRTVTAQREITNIQATAAAQAAKIQSEAEGQAAVLKAKGEADARLIIARAEADSQVITAESEAKSRRLDAASRNDAATIMHNEFARSQFFLWSQSLISHLLQQLTPWPLNKCNLLPISSVTR